MSQREHRRDNLAELISDMESDVRDLTRWASTVFELGTSDNDPSDCLLVIGPVMREIAERVEASWEHAFKLSRPLREGAR
ncbi:hypothetical protein [Methylobacterium sp. J-077]|uniref:hypothetical protein n=1 Tax=Methylobacterium sp. J-077 TaxID=2836656 RepID=UPI001FB893AA|nr:hypothetical protein [Methylobacterium sp. J-077]MCJ2126772.1 hypothetical protein [Methylobacterium sp. J-077]